jgi:hypothetical protein
MLQPRKENNKLQHKANKIRLRMRQRGKRRLRNA